MVFRDLTTASVHSRFMDLALSTLKLKKGQNPVDTGLLGQNLFVSMMAAEELLLFLRRTHLKPKILNSTP